MHYSISQLDKQHRPKFFWPGLIWLTKLRLTSQGPLVHWSVKQPLVNYGSPKLTKHSEFLCSVPCLHALDVGSFRGNRRREGKFLLYWTTKLNIALKAREIFLSDFIAMIRSVRIGNKTKMFRPR